MTTQHCIALAIGAILVILLVRPGSLKLKAKRGEDEANLEYLPVIIEETKKE